MKAPETFDRRVLLCVSGMTPQVVTETIYGLLTQTPAFVPTEIHVITTTAGAGKARASLLDNPRVQQLYTEYGHGDALPTFGPDNIHVPHGDDGRKLDDIRTVDDNAAMADSILELASELTEGDSAVHASIAGGRKTMSYYLGNVMGLVGRPQDRISHVLVNEPFEFHPEFFYPTKQSQPLTTADGEVDAADAQIALANVPFVSLNQRLPKPFVKRFRKEGNLFSKAVQTAQLNVERPRLLIDLNARGAFIGRQTPIALQLPPSALALYAVAAALRKRSDGDDGASVFPYGELPLRALQEIRRYGDLQQVDSKGADLLDKYQDRRDPEDEKDYYDRRNNDINKALDAIGSFIAPIYGLSAPRTGQRGLLGLKPDQIEFRMLDNAWGDTLGINELDFS